MGPIKLIRKLGGVIRGGAALRAVFLGVLLGFAIGMIPGFNLTLVICILALVLLSTNGAMAALAFILGKVLCFALAPVTFHIGHFMIHSLGLKGLVRWLADTPVLALLDWHVYCLMGALPVIIVVGGGLAVVIVTLLSKVRTSMAAATDKSERLSNLAQRKLVRFLLWLAAGKQKESFAEMLHKKTPLVRKGRLIACVVVVAVLAVLQIVYADLLLRKAIEAGASAAYGAEVNVANAELSLSKGRLVIEGLQITDRESPDLNVLQADRIEANIDVAALLTKRIDIDITSCDKARTGVPRAKPGWVREEAPAEKKPPLAERLPGLKDAEKYAEYVKRVDDFKKMLDMLMDYLAKGKDADEEDLAARERAKAYLRRSVKDSLAKHPTWAVKEIAVHSIEIDPGMPTFGIVIRNVSSHPDLYPGEASFEVRPDPDAKKKILGSVFDKVLGKDKKPGGGLLKGLLDR